MMQTTTPSPFPLNDPRDDVMASRRTEALQALYDQTVDALRGFEKMVEKAKPAFRDTAERFCLLHSRHAGELAGMLLEQGVEVTDEGTLMGTVNQTVVALRAFFDQIDEDVMDQIRKGEDWVLGSFDEAIDEQNDRVAARLKEMRTELTKLLADTRHLG